jgi:hypothetical protein
MTKINEVPGEPIFLTAGMTIPRVLVEPDTSIDSGAFTSLQRSVSVAIPEGDMVALRKRLKSKDHLDTVVALRYLKGRSLLPWRKRLAVSREKSLTFRGLLQRAILRH